MSAFDAQTPRVPVLLVTGFLGSGKTTLVNRLLKLKDFSRAAVVVNEYGEVSIDHVLVEAPRYRMRVVDSGCLCGHVHDEIASSLLDLQAKRGRRPDRDFDCVLIEMSGLADPVPVIQLLLTDPHVTTYYELKTVIAVADGVHGGDHLVRHPESIKQAAVADTIILSKSDIADCAQPRRACRADRGDQSRRAAVARRARRRTRRANPRSRRLRRRRAAATPRAAGSMTVPMPQPLRPPRPTRRSRPSPSLTMKRSPCPASCSG